MIRLNGLDREMSITDRCMQKILIKKYQRIFRKMEIKKGYLGLGQGRVLLAERKPYTYQNEKKKESQDQITKEPIFRIVKENIKIRNSMTIELLPIKRKQKQQYYYWKNNNQKHSIISLLFLLLG